MKSLVNLEKAFRQTRLLALVSIILATFVSGFTVLQSYKFAEQQRQKIYVLDNGNSLLLALSQDINENRPVEAKDHVKNFHKLFFSLDPDPKAIDKNMQEALFLCDESAKKEYDNLKERGYFAQLVAGNISQTVQVDSVAVDFSAYPYYARYYGKEKIIRSTTVTERKLVSQCYLRNVARTENNPHGFLMEKWEVLENTDISSILR